ncbi:MAG: cofactor-independent phosphoglycerate mutase [Clostridia bacterium]|nr:cofactor-independent phosphoglycerate mutase [Clostridia bacterium]
MKYVVILGDGMADYPIESIGNKTPLMVANKPNIDALCQKGEIGLVKTVPQGLKPGSDVANLAVMGYNPLKCYTGRSPLEALSIGIDLKDDDIATRCNLVTLSDDEKYEDKTMVDYSAGEITTKEAKELIEFIQSKLGTDNLAFYAGVSYRHCLVKHHAKVGTTYTPPHDISGRKITGYLPKDLYGDEMLSLMKKSYELLKDHPINKERVKNGKNPANSIWLWGEGTKPQLESFTSKWGIKGSVISAVDLLKGIGIGAKMEVIEVEGACGTYETNFAGKAKAAIDSLKRNDYVYIHMEAPDECGHQGDLEHKILSIEKIDSIVVKYIVEELSKQSEPFSILVAPDHPTPIALKTHVSDPVPYIIYRSNKELDNKAKTYNEQTAKDSGIYYASSEELIQKFIKEV